MVRSGVDAIDAGKAFCQPDCAQARRDSAEGVERQPHRRDDTPELEVGPSNRTSLGGDPDSVTDRNGQRNEGVVARGEPKRQPELELAHDTQGAEINSTNAVAPEVS